MDTEKLLRILTDILSDEESLGVGGKIEEMRTSVAQNNSQGFTQAKTQADEFISAFKGQATSYRFSHTEGLLLKKVGGSTFFGKGLVNRLESIFRNSGYEVLAKIDDYRTKRSDFVKKAQRLSAALTEIGVEEYRPDEYEVGIVLPDEEADFDKLTKRVRDLKLLLGALAEATGTSRDHLKVTRLSNGTFELFSLQPAEVAVLLSSLLLNVSAIWDKITQFRKRMNDTDKDELLSPEAKKKIKDTLKEETENIKREILEEMPDKFVEGLNKKLDEGRKNEIRNQIRIGVHAIFAGFEAGVEIDVTPIRVETEGEPSAKETKMVAAIEKTNAQLKAIYELPPEMKKLPFALPAPKEIATEKKAKKTSSKKKRDDGQVQ